MADRNDIEWNIKWEDEILKVEHEAYTTLLSRTFTDYKSVYTGNRSWYGAIPEVRIIGSISGRVIAHAGLLRRFLHAPVSDSSILVGDIGLVVVDPDYQSNGIGSLLLKETAQLMDELNIPTGFLTCLSKMTPFYEANGWRQLVGQQVRVLDTSHRVLISESIPMFLPITASENQWPNEQILDRNGLEV